MNEKPCTILIHYDKVEPPQINELKKQLEKGSMEEKSDALKQVILLLLNGENLSQLLMTIIRFVMPITEHNLKKLLLLYLEIIDKTSPDGKLLSEMILVWYIFLYIDSSNALRNDLNHPNEYVRGATFRFLSKLKEPEILEPLLPSIRANLEYKHAYVKRNAVLSLYNVYKNFEYLCPDAPELVFNFLLNEGDAACKRNAFLMLFNCAQDKAVEYLSEVLDQVANMGDILQLIIVELIKKVCRTNQGERAKYIKCIFTLLSSSSPAVQYEAAGTLLLLSGAPTAVRAAASAYIELLVKESDNNVKLIVLDRLLLIKKHHSKILQSLLMDILRALASPNMEIRQKTLDIALDLVSPKNIEEVVLVLKKEIQKTQSKELDKATEYRQMLIQAIHACAIKFPEIAASVIQLLMDFIGDNSSAALEVMFFVREVAETYPDLRSSIVTKLLDGFTQITSSKVFRCAMWIVGEYSQTPTEIDALFTTLKEAIGEVPFIAQEEEEEKEKEKEAEKAKAKTKFSSSSGPNKVLPDGTYATQSAYTASPVEMSQGTSQLRQLLLNGEWYLAAVVSVTLTKAALRLHQTGVGTHTDYFLTAQVMTYLTAFLRLGQSSVPPSPMDSDSHDRIVLCLRVLSQPSPLAQKVFLESCRKSFAQMIEEEKRAAPIVKQIKSEVSVQADDLIKVRQLLPKRTFGLEAFEEMAEEWDVTKVGGAVADDHQNLSRVYQLTGFSDPLYAEAFVHVNQYDVMLDVTVINQTPETLQNLNLELATLGDLKLVERPQTYTMAPHSTKQIRANIKVSSTETGIIFGNIVYDIAGVSSNDKNCVVLNDIHIDIMDYITPASCSELKFRSMWAEFEWENKVAVNTNIGNVKDFLHHIVKSTNMNCLTPASALDGDCNFLSANLYAKSVFGEDALANVSIELQSEGKITGFIRIRSKTQGIALSLGDKITLKQRVNTP